MFIYFLYLILWLNNNYYIYIIYNITYIIYYINFISIKQWTILNKKISNFKLMTKYPTIFGYWLFYVTHCDTPKMHNSKFVFCNKRSWSQENFPTRGSWTATFTVSLPVLDPLIESHSIDSDLNDSGLELHVLLELLLAFTNFISLVFHTNQIYMKYWS